MPLGGPEGHVGWIETGFVLGLGQGLGTPPAMMSFSFGACTGAGITHTCLPVPQVCRGAPADAQAPGNVWLWF